MRYPTVPSSIGPRFLVAFGVFLAALLGAQPGPAEAREGNKTIKLHFGHTGEKGEFTFKRNGRYDRAELARINRFLRDWRRNEPAKMDPQLFDLIWSIYRETGSRDYIHVVSAYRSLATNNMLRKRSRGVAEKSQHTAGKAMDFYIPGVPLAKLRAVAMKHQGGGVGYYPRSGSPFVHVDTGNVRSWPRMTRQQLLALFPNGETLYLPTDGKPLPGYERALAKRKTGGTTALAYLEPGTTETERSSGGGDKDNVSGWLKRVFDGGADEAEDNDESVAVKETAVAAAAPVEKPAQTAAEATAPLPAAIGEPQDLIAGADDGLDARLPRSRPAAETELAFAALAPTIPPDAPIAAEDASTVASLAFAPLPRSRPDAALLAESLGKPADAPTALSVNAEDAIAALASVSDGAPAPQPSTSQDPVYAALAESETRGTLPTDADSAILAGFAAIEDLAPASADTQAALVAAVASAGKAADAPRPRPRPLALAYAGIGLKAPAPAASPAPPPEAPPEQSLAVSERINNVPMPPAPAYDIDADTLRQLIGKAAAENPDLSKFEMPRPAGTPGLFTVPQSADSVAKRSPDPEPPTGRFHQAEADAPESFFSRLFASLAE